MTPNAVIFDLDDTLYDETSYFIQVIEAFEAIKGLEQGTVGSSYSRELRKQSRDIISDLLHGSGHLSRENHELLFSLYLSHPASLTPYSGVLDTLRTLRRRGIQVALLTNGLVAAQQNKVNALGLAGELDHIEFARIQGRDTEKPHPAAFQRVLQELGLQPGDALMIGDDLEKDIYPALNLGMNAIWRTGQKAHRLPVMSIQRISDLMNII